jgi:hypothetical protein
VLDAHGCSDEISFTLGTSSVQNPAEEVQISLYPNPASGVATLEVQFKQATEAQVEIINPLGQRVRMASFKDATQLTELIDLEGMIPGLYLVRIMANGKTISRKLVKS